VEGMVPVRDLDDDYYQYDAQEEKLTGRRTKKYYQLGERLLIQVAKVNKEKMQIDFTVLKKLK